MFALWTCPEPCGAKNSTKQRVCEVCGSERVRAGASEPPNIACERCGEGVVFWTSLTPGEDGVKRCATCHIGYLRARMAVNPATPEVIVEAKAMLRRLTECYESTR